MILKVDPPIISNLNIKHVQWFDERFYRVEYYENDVLKIKFLPSVTTKLGVTSKPFLAKWRGDVGNREADMVVFTSQQRGKRLHDAWYKMCMGGEVIFNPWDRPIFTKEQIDESIAKHNGLVSVIQFQEEMLHLVRLYKWVEIVKPKFLFSEKTVYSLKHNDAGTIDTACWIAGGEYWVNGSAPLVIPAGNYILDLKTGKEVDHDAYLQTATYLKCAEEVDPTTKYNGTIILHTQSKVRKGIEGLSTLLHTRAEAEEHYLEYRVVAELWDRRNKDAMPKFFEFPATLNFQNLKIA